ncbi:putative 26S proteasome regulatory subunit N12 [Monocercomonoides exilis]|uniref:putative 26S proteasome regulatory subunit N12 n=1 Tax=Monocercomonoides exilis TaxID=2049356 RepID=UPI00355A099E|nr:putative 26S proteasome regulatory subunit N12 [Monocercomonoides exilis]
MSSGNLKQRLDEVKSQISSKKNLEALADSIDDIMTEIFEGDLPTSVEDLVFVRDVAETGARIAAYQPNMESFVRYSMQLDSLNKNKPPLPPSDLSIHLKAVYLFAILSQKNYSLFNLLAEALTSAEKNTPYIKFACGISDQLHGSVYETLWMIREQLPSDLFEKFYDILCENHRDEIATYVGKGYISLSYADAAKFLILPSPSVETIRPLAQKHGWILNEAEGKVYFSATSSASASSSSSASSSEASSSSRLTKSVAMPSTLPSRQLIRTALQRAAEYEQIV